MKPKDVRTLRVKKTFSTFPTSVEDVGGGLTISVARDYGAGFAVFDVGHIVVDVGPISSVIGKVRWPRFKARHYARSSTQTYNSLWCTAAGQPTANIMPGESVVAGFYRLVNQQMFNMNGYHFNAENTGITSGVVLFTPPADWLDYTGVSSSDWPSEIAEEKPLASVRPETVGSERRVILGRTYTPGSEGTFAQSFRDAVLDTSEFARPMSFFLGYSMSGWDNLPSVANPQWNSFTDVELLLNFSQEDLDGLPTPPNTQAVVGGLTDEFEDAVLQYLAFGNVDGMAGFVPLSYAYFIGRAFEREKSILPTDVVGQAAVNMVADSGSVAGMVLLEDVPGESVSSVALVGKSGLVAAYGELVKPMFGKTGQRGTAAVRIEFNGKYMSKLGMFAVLAYLASGGSVLMHGEGRTLGLYSGDPRVGGSRLGGTTFSSTMMRKVSATTYVNSEDIKLIADAGFSAKVATHVAIERDGTPLLVMPVKEPIIVRRGMDVTMRTGGLILTVG